MVAVIVMFVIIALIGLCVYGSTIVSDPIVYIAEDEDACSACDLNVICPDCWGMIEQRCSCNYRNMRRCQCAYNDIGQQGG